MIQHSLTELTVTRIFSTQKVQLARFLIILFVIQLLLVRVVRVVLVQSNRYIQLRSNNPILYVGLPRFWFVSGM